MASDGRAEGAGAVVISAPIEEEIAQLDDAERAEFLEAMGLHEAGLDRLIHEAYACSACRPISPSARRKPAPGPSRRAPARPQAAGVIHGDFEKGFIRAETIAYDDYVALGGEAGAREAGRLRVEGKTYEVKDGDVLHFLFSS